MPNAATGHYRPRKQAKAKDFLRVCLLFLNRGVSTGRPERRFAFYIYVIVIRRTGAGEQVGADRRQARNVSHDTTTLSRWKGCYLCTFEYEPSCKSLSQSERLHSSRPRRRRRNCSTSIRTAPIVSITPVSVLRETASSGIHSSRRWQKRRSWCPTTTRRSLSTSTSASAGV